MLFGNRYESSWCLTTYACDSREMERSFSGPFAELCFFLIKKDSKDEPVLAIEKPTVKYDYGQSFGFDLVNHMSVSLQEPLSSIRSE